MFLAHVICALGQDQEVAGTIHTSWTTCEIYDVVGVNRILNTKWPYITKLGRSSQLAVARLNRSEGWCENMKKNDIQGGDSSHPNQSPFGHDQSMTIFSRLQIRSSQLQDMLGLRRKSVRPNLGRVWSGWSEVEHPYCITTITCGMCNDQVSLAMKHLARVLPKQPNNSDGFPCEQESHRHLGHLIRVGSITSRISKLRMASVMGVLTHLDPNSVTSPASTGRRCGNCANCIQRCFPMNGKVIDVHVFQPTNSLWSKISKAGWQQKASLCQDIRPIAVDTLKCHLPNLPSRFWYRLPLGQRALADPQPTPGLEHGLDPPGYHGKTRKEKKRSMSTRFGSRTHNPHPLSSTH